VILPGENIYTVVAILWEHLDAVDPEYSRRDLVSRSTRVAGLVAAVCCTAFAFDRLAVMLPTLGF
jgi:hypothetical protein